MKLIPSLASLLFLALGILSLASCKDEDPCATWDDDIQAIVNSSCAYAGCHSGPATAGMFVPAAVNDFTSYAATKPSLDNGTFSAEVLIDKTMPPAAFVPAGNPTELTTAQIDLIQCWADADFPEN